MARQIPIKTIHTNKAISVTSIASFGVANKKTSIATNAQASVAITNGSLIGRDLPVCDDL